MSSKVRSVSHEPPDSLPVPPSRWDQLFADLEHQLAAERAQEARWEVAELVRTERAAVTTADRVRDAGGSVLRVHVAADEVVEGTVVDAAAQWLLIDVGQGRRALVPTAAMCVVDGLGRRAAPPAGRVESALSLGHVLRALGRDRAVVAVRTAAGEVVGRIDGVGADHLDLGLEQPAGRQVVVPFAAVRSVVTR